ncbi:hypothetical protein Ancab_028102 [Ancistrocladus abbreviatus]
MDAETGATTAEVPYVDKTTGIQHEVRSLKRMVSIEESSHLKVLHLVDGTIIKTKRWQNGWGSRSRHLLQDMPSGDMQIRRKAIDKEMEDNPEKMKEFVLNKFDKVPDKVKDVFKITNQDDLVCSQLRYRAPWEILRADISRDNVCVAGDALHPMTPDLGQGACSALEDSVILARCLAEAFAKNSTGENVQRRRNTRELR